MIDTKKKNRLFLPPRNESACRVVVNTFSSLSLSLSFNTPPQFAIFRVHAMDLSLGVCAWLEKIHNNIHSIVFPCCRRTTYSKLLQTDSIVVSWINNLPLLSRARRETAPKFVFLTHKKWPHTLASDKSAKMKCATLLLVKPEDRFFFAAAAAMQNPNVVTMQNPGVKRDCC